MAEDTRVICYNLVVTLPLFFLVYYMASSLLSGALKLTDFDGKIPFDFKSCCFGSNKNLVTLLSLVLTYTITTAVYVIFIRRRIWDYAITTAIIHLLLSCAVMQDFPTNWEWWIAFLLSVAFMAVFGEIVMRYCCTKRRELTISPERNVVT